MVVYFGTLCLIYVIDTFVYVMADTEDTFTAILWGLFIITMLVTAYLNGVIVSALIILGALFLTYFICHVVNKKLFIARVYLRVINRLMQVGLHGLLAGFLAFAITGLILSSNLYGNLSDLYATVSNFKFSFGFIFGMLSDWYTMISNINIDFGYLFGIHPLIVIWSVAVACLTPRFHAGVVAISEEIIVSIFGLIGLILLVLATIALIVGALGFVLGKLVTP
jgi:hypothetical protein